MVLFYFDVEFFLNNYSSFYLFIIALCIYFNNIRLFLINLYVIQCFFTVIYFFYSIPSVGYVLALNRYDECFKGFPDRSNLIDLFLHLTYMRKVRYYFDKKYKCVV